MATQVQQLSVEDVTDLTTDLSLSNGTTYFIQALTPGRVFIAELASAPAGIGGPAHVMLPYETWEIEQGSDNFYAWGNGSVVVTEA